MANVGQFIELKQSQSLVMTTQLQQAIKMLQMTNVEISAFVQEELERNPLLVEAETRDNESQLNEKELGAREELNIGSGETISQANEALDAPREDTDAGDSMSDQAMTTCPTSGEPQQGPSAASGDNWQSGAKGPIGDDIDAFEERTAHDVSLREHLLTELQKIPFSPADKLIAQRLVDETDEAGFMRGDIMEIAEQLGATADSVTATLLRCQQLDPIGVMARDIGECFKLQLAERDRLDPAMALAIDNIEMLAGRQFEAVAELCNVSREDAEDMLEEIKMLTPRPGAAFAGAIAPAITPDVIIREMPNGHYAIELNNDTLPRVLVDQAYYAEINALGPKGDDKDFISECVHNANWLVKSLDQRARTILKVAKEIVRQQDAFFAKGVEALKPLNLKTVAEAIEMHESTVSRVTSNKYMATPRGLFQLKYFFSAAIAGASSEEAHSAEAVRYRIKALISEETAKTVLSDDALVARLKDFDIDIARRTVAKYRESMNIPSSVIRRRALKSAA